MKSTWKLSLVAIMAGALALVLILGASMGTAAAPDPALAGDLVIFGDAGGSRVRFIDVDAGTVVGDATGPDVLSNHGVVFDGRYVYTANAGISPAGSGIIKAVQLDTATMSQSAAYSMYNSGGGGLCGIELDRNVSGANLWVEDMSAPAGVGGGWEVNPTTGFTGSYVDTGNGTENRSTCGIGWDSTGSIAYASLMFAQATNEMSWPGGPTTGAGASHAVTVHILDTAKAAGYAYVSGGVGTGVGSRIDVVELSTMNVVGSIALPGTNPHSVEVTDDEGFAYAQTRVVAGGTAQGILVFDIGGGSAGGTKTAPVQIGFIPGGGSGGSCGVDVAAKSDYCSQPALSLTKDAVYWASYSNYVEGDLSVDFTISNNSAGSQSAHNVTLNGATNTNGVTLTSSTAIANIAAGGSSSFTAHYSVPMGVMNFMTSLSVSADDLCGNSYNYGA